MNQNELFLKRTDALAEKLRITLREACIYVGLSTGSFFGYRTGRVPITNKAWKKLEEAEIKAGLNQSTSASAVDDDSPQSAESGRIEVDKFTALEAKVELLTRMVETLLGQTKVRTMKQDVATSSPSLGNTIPAKKKTTIPKKLA
jgi:hypothetical protein